MRRFWLVVIFSVTACAHAAQSSRSNTVWADDQEQLGSPLPRSRGDTPRRTPRLTAGCLVGSLRDRDRPLVNFDQAHIEVDHRGTIVRAAPVNNQGKFKVCIQALGEGEDQRGLAVDLLAYAHGYQNKRVRTFWDPAKATELTIWMEALP